LARALDGPTLIYLDGADKRALFVVVLQHGNEDTGLLALQRLLRDYRERQLPRSLWLFIANPQAAGHGLRTLPGRPDLNRCWPGTEMPDCAETRLLTAVFEIVTNGPLFASLDLHNTTGESPPHVGINRLEPRFLQLARLYTSTAIHFVRPLGAQSQAFARMCPSATLECGRAGSATALERTRAFLQRCLLLDPLPEHPPEPRELALYQSVARVFVTADFAVSFGGDSERTLRLDPAVDELNFRELEPGTPLGHCDSQRWPIYAIDANGADVTARYFELVEGALRLRQRVMPSLLSTDARVVREDCLCQLTVPLNGPLGA